jgi:hypothetical protein
MQGVAGDGCFSAGGQAADKVGFPNSIRTFHGIAPTL